MVFFGRNILLAGAILVLPVAANAATFSSDLYSGMFGSKASVLSPNKKIKFLFNVMEDLNIGSFAVSATGKNVGADFADIRYGSTSPGRNAFTMINSIGSSSFGGGFLPGMMLSKGRVFSVFFTGGVANPVSVGRSFVSSAPAAVPLPASWMLLGGTLLVGGLFGSRRRKTSHGELAI